MTPSVRFGSQALWCSLIFFPAGWIPSESHSRCMWQGFYLRKFCKSRSLHRSPEAHIAECSFARSRFMRGHPPSRISENHSGKSLWIKSSVQVALSSRPGSFRQPSLAWSQRCLQSWSEVGSILYSSCHSQPSSRPAVFSPDCRSIGGHPAGIGVRWCNCWSQTLCYVAPIRECSAPLA